MQRGAQVGSTASSGYLNSFNALAQLAGQGVNRAFHRLARVLAGIRQVRRLSVGWATSS